MVVGSAPWVWRWMRPDRRPGVAERLILGSSLAVAATLSARCPGADRRLAWTELRNAVEAYRLFRLVRAPRHGQSDLAALVDALACRDRFTSLWMLEGLGFDLARGALAAGEISQPLLADERTRELPAGSLVPLHAGLGLALAVDLLPRRTGEARVTAAAIQSFVADCREHASTGCSSVAVEALGLVACLLPLGPAQELAGFLGRPDPAIADLFWHGFGRGCYFLHALWPAARSARWRVLDLAREAAPDERARQALLAGICFPLLMLNIRQPRVLERYLLDEGEGLAGEPAVRRGLRGAALVWHSWAGRTPDLDRLLAHRPAGRGLARPWTRLVIESCEGALAEAGGGPAATRRFGALFF